mmetsp:Transcript_18012/g.38683  ORF Transcript_18012/g.38683 Transcript_18012/m.38683 type:complete len:252 (+) Transcript_18012:780-1535(+)
MERLQRELYRARSRPGWRAPAWRGAHPLAVARADVRGGRLWLRLLSRAAPGGSAARRVRTAIAHISVRLPPIGEGWFILGLELSAASGGMRTHSQIARQVGGMRCASLGCGLPLRSIMPRQACMSHTTRRDRRWHAHVAPHRRVADECVPSANKDGRVSPETFILTSLVRAVACAASMSSSRSRRHRQAPPSSLLAVGRSRTASTGVSMGERRAIPASCSCTALTPTVPRCLDSGDECGRNSDFKGLGAVI